MLDAVSLNTNICVISIGGTGVYYMLKQQTCRAHAVASITEPIYPCQQSNGDRDIYRYHLLDHKVTANFSHYIIESSGKIQFVPTLTYL